MPAWRKVLVRMPDEKRTARVRSRFQGDSPVMLAIDTSTDIATIGVGVNPFTCAESYFKTEKGHSGKLMPMVESLLETVSIKPGDLNLIIAGLGPGTFSGVKVGVATAKSLAMGLNVGITGMSSLDTLAMVAPPLDCDLVLSVMDAKRDMLYAALYETGGALPERVCGPGCLPAFEAASKVIGSRSGKLAVIGYTEPGFLESVRETGVTVVCARDATPRARDMLKAGKRLELKGTMEPESIEPIYLKSAT